MPQQSGDDADLAEVKPRGIPAICTMIQPWKAPLIAVVRIISPVPQAA